MKIFFIFLISLLMFSIAIGDEEFGTIANKPVAPENVVFVNIKNASKDVRYKIMRDGRCLTALEVVNLVGEFGALMKVKDASTVPYIVKGDRVYKINGKEKVCPDKNEMQKENTNPSNNFNIAKTGSENTEQASKQSIQNNAPAAATTNNTITSSNNIASPFESMGSDNTVKAENPVSSAKIGTFEWDEIIFDEQDKDNISMEPISAWTLSNNSADSFKSKSFIAPLEGSSKKATWKCTIPEDGLYNISLWWAIPMNGKLSNTAPVIIHTATGDVPLTLDQSVNSRKFNSIGDFKLKSGKDTPVITFTNEGAIDKSGFICVDAIKISYKAAN